MQRRSELIAIIGFVFACTACGPSASKQLSQPNWHTGAAAFRGHEDLSRFAVDAANANLAGSFHYPAIPSGENGAISRHPIVKGNYETDFPSARMYGYYGANQNVDWHSDASLQFIHGLRNHVGGNLVSNRQACATVQQAITRTADAALRDYRSGQWESGMYWAGHALHIIQDTYSPAHVTRIGFEGRQIVDFCSYSIRQNGTCFHDKVDQRDRIWRTDSLSCTFDSDKRTWDCLSPNAKDAAIASTTLLVQLARAYTSGGDIVVHMNQFFNERLNCSGL